MNGYTGWGILPATKDRLLQMFPAKYPDLIAHHVTFKFGVDEQAFIPTERIGEVIGVADNGHNVQALIVAINGSPLREDGGTYHITWSLDTSLGAKPVDSNKVIVDFGWTRLHHPVVIPLFPRFFPN